MTILGNATITGGSTSNLTIIVHNIGNVNETRVILTFRGVPGDWVRITPTSTNISAGSSQRYLVSISVPSNETGTRRILFTAISAEGTNVSRLVTLNIIAPTPSVVIPSAVCGNGICEPGETPENCSVDCAISTPISSPLARISGAMVSVVTTPMGQAISGGIVSFVVGVFLIRFIAKRRKPWKANFSPSHQEKLLRKLKKQTRRPHGG